MKQRIISKGLTVAVILLFLCVGIQPAIATVEPKTSDDEDDCNLCPKASKQHINRLTTRLNRFEKYINQFSASSKLNPEFEEIFEEFINEINDNFGYCLLLLMKIFIVGKIAVYSEIISMVLPEDSPLSIIFHNLWHFFWNKTTQLLDSGKDYDCWWWEGDFHP